MLRRIGAMLGLSPAPDASEADEARLAAAALLMEVALADGTERVIERATAERVVVERFGLGVEAARELVAKGRAAGDGSPDLVRHTRVLKRALEPADRVEVLVALWRVVLADGRLDGYEEAVVRQVAGLLHVTDADRAAARRLAIERLAGSSI